MTFEVKPEQINPGIKNPYPDYGKCKTCSHFVPGYEAGGADRGECRCHPKIEPVLATGWCGEHKPKMILG